MLEDVSGQLRQAQGFEPADGAVHEGGGDADEALVDLVDRAETAVVVTERAGDRGGGDGERERGDQGIHGDVEKLLRADLFLTKNTKNILP